MEVYTMPGTDRIRRRFERTPGIDLPGDNPNMPIGKFYLQVQPDVRALFGTAYAQLKNPLLKGEITYDEIHKGPPWTSGGDFINVKVDLPSKQVMGVGTYHGIVDVSYYGIGTGPVIYEGGFSPVGVYDGWNIPSMVNGPNYIPSTAAWELAAYKQTKPKIQKADAFIFGAEARDIPRMLRSTSQTLHTSWLNLGGREMTRLMQPKKIADNFLNHQFGWVPFLSDIRKLYRTHQNSVAIKRQLTRNNDRWVTRKKVLSNETDQNIWSKGNGMSVEPAGYYIGTLFDAGTSPTYELKEEIRSEISAVGSYKYYRPEFDPDMPDYNSAWSNLNRDLAIYGARISPSNVYRATPWTWLVDWFTDFGGNIDTITDWAQDSIVARYLFVMRHDIREQVFTQTLPFSGNHLSLQWSAKMEGKIRKQASTPYGFGLEWKFLSPRQLAILAALKLTRP
jgi:hypothetical protein